MADIYLLVYRRIPELSSLNDLHCGSQLIFNGEGKAEAIGSTKLRTLTLFYFTPFYVKQFVPHIGDKLID